MKLNLHKRKNGFPKSEVMEKMCIAQYDANGDMLEHDCIKARNRAAIGEIIQVLGKYDLTVGQAQALLRECNSFIDITFAQEALKDYVPRLMNGLRQE